MSLSSKSAITKLQAVLLLVVLVLAVGAGVAYYNLTVRPPTVKVLKIGIGTDADTLDPAGQTTTLVQNIVNFMYQTLVYQDEKGQVKPLLATAWNVSSDGLVYTMKLRRDVKFHDGTPFDASIVKFTMDRVLDPNVRVPLRAYITMLDRTEIIDPYTVRLVLKFPFAPFIPVLSLVSWAMVLPSAVQKYGDKFAENPVGTGPFKFKEWVKGDRIVLERNENYWGDKATFDQVIFRIVPEAGTRVSMLLAGDVDMIYKPSPADLPKLQANPDVVVSTVDSTRTIFIAINNQFGPFKDKRVRQALNYAVDKESIVKNILLGLATVYDSPVPSSFFGHASIGAYPYDPAKAKQLLKDAGYPTGFKTVLISPSGRYTLDIQMAQAVQGYLKDVGIDAEVRTMDWPTYIATITKPLNETNVELHVLGWGPFVLDADQTLSAMFNSAYWPPQGLATAFYKNVQVDKLINDARMSIDPKVRQDLYAQAQKIIMDDAPWIFMYIEKFTLAWRKPLKGVIVFPFETFDITYAKFEQ